MIRLAGIAALLAGCAAEPPLPPTQGGTAPATIRQAAPTRFDGRYTGPLVLNPDRTRSCPKLDAQERVLTVQGGRGTLEIEPATRQILSGFVDSQGALRLADRIDRTIATEGIFTDSTFLGEHRNGLCSYAVRLRKRE